MTTPSDNIMIECAENCGNSPKKQLLKDLTIAFVHHKITFCMDWMTDDVVWEIIGDKMLRGKIDFEQALHQMKNPEVQQLHIQNIITHGNVASVNGTIMLNDTQCIAFCNVYSFRAGGKHSKIKAITSYIIRTS